MYDMHQEKTRYTKLAWAVTITSALFFFYEFIQMNLFNTINTQLRTEFNLDSIQIGQLFSMYFYANALFLFAAGSLLDRYSTKKLLLGAIAICTTGTFIFALADVYWVAAVGRFLIGAGASFCFLSCIRIASRWFAPHRMAFVTGVVVTLAMLGGLVAQAPFALLINFLGNWHHALLLNAFLGVIIFTATVFIVRDYPPDAQDVAKEEKAQLDNLGLIACLKLAALNPQNWIAGLYTTLMNLPVFILGGLWGVLYLQKVRGITAEQASIATTLFFVGVIFGSLIFGWVSDHIERRVLPMIVGAVLSLVTIAILMYVPNLSLTMLIILFFLIGFITSSQVLTYPTVAELNPTYLTSTAVSIESFCIMASGFIVPPLFGWLMQQSSGNKVVNGIVDYSAHSFDMAMLIIPASFIVALLLTFVMRETYCRSQV